MTHIIATSDLHGHLPTIPSCDLLIIAGDICLDGFVTQQAAWMDTTLRKWLDDLPAKEVVVVAGNHDLIFEQASHLVPKKLRWHYLQEEQIELFGLQIYGMPWQLPFWGAFNLSEEQLLEHYEEIPKKIDILISHGPPFGIGDEVPKHSGQHVGSHALYNKIKEIKPKLFICGHIHCSFGLYQIESTTVANVSLLDDDMEIAHQPLMFEV